MQVEKRLKNQTSRAIQGPSQVIVHSLANSWNFDGGVGWLTDPNNPLEAHYAVRKDGHVVQIVDESRQADANYHANVRAISIETDSDLLALAQWTDEQVATLVELIADICERHGIPPVLTPAWDAPGLGWHIMWGTPGYWTPVAKACPGPARIAQFKTAIVPAVAAELTRRRGGLQDKPADPTPAPETPGAPAPLPATEDDDDMAYSVLYDVVTDFHYLSAPGEWVTLGPGGWPVQGVPNIPEGAYTYETLINHLASVGLSKPFSARVAQNTIQLVAARLGALGQSAAETAADDNRGIKHGDGWI